MNRTRFCLLPAILLTLLSAHGADDAAATFASRMRDTLRATMQQLNDAQNQLAVAQAAQAQDDKDKADLQAKLDAANGQLKTLTDQSQADQDTARKTITSLNDQIATDTKQIAAYTDALAQWKVAYNQTAQLYKNTEQQRAQLAAQNAILARLVDDRELKNAELYRTAVEILNRYDRFGLGDALSAKEPFVGVTRVKLQNLVQDYQDKLLDERISPGQPVSTPAPPAARSGTPAGIKTAQNPNTLEKVSPR